MGRPKELSRPPAFFLDPRAPEPTLLEEEADHARRVLRMRVGDELEGLDGLGHRRRLRIVALDRGRFEVEPLGEPEEEPPPGVPGARLPWIEVAVAWPKRTRVEAMLDQATQLGVAAITPLTAERRGPEPVPDPAPERWSRVLRTACKQSRRLWMPELLSPRSPAELAEERPGDTLAVLDPGGGMSLDTWLRSIPVSQGGPGTRARPVTLVIGPEGGLTPAEREAFLAHGGTTVRIGPHVLRIETAVAAALGLSACVLERAPWPRPDGDVRTYTFPS